MAHHANIEKMFFMQQQFSEDPENLVVPLFEKFNCTTQIHQFIVKRILWLCTYKFMAMYTLYDIAWKLTMLCSEKSEALLMQMCFFSKFCCSVVSNSLVCIEYCNPNLKGALYFRIVGCLRNSQQKFFISSDCRNMLEWNQFRPNFCALLNAPETLNRR